MQKRIVWVFFVLAVAIIALLVVKKNYQAPGQKIDAEPQNVSPQDVSVLNTRPVAMQLYGGEEAISTNIKLNEDETLIAVVSDDFDGDGFYDEVDAIKTVSSPYISLLVGLYSPELQLYERSTIIHTQISQISSFSYSGIDLTGDHRLSIVYQGITDTGMSVLHAYYVSKVSGKLNVNEIASFQSDDEIYIQEVPRSETYDMGESNDSSYPIWVYSSNAANPNSRDQVQTMYDWNVEKKQYVVIRTNVVPGASFVNKELSAVQGGGVENFTEYLSGLWYQEGTGKSNRYYIYFNYSDKEIVFLHKDTQEIYDWGSNQVRFSGLWITTVNHEINNLTRRIDIALKGTDLVQVRLRDDVRMVISEGTEWDGDYRRLSAKEFYIQQNTVPVDEDHTTRYIQQLEEGPLWKSSDGSVIKFANGNYTAVGADGVTDKGIYAKFQFMDMPFIQLRSNTETSWFGGMYLISSADEAGEDDVIDTMVLQPYVLTPDSASVSENERPLILNRTSQNE